MIYRYLGKVDTFSTTLYPTVTGIIDIQIPACLIFDQSYPLQTDGTTQTVESVTYKILHKEFIIKSQHQKKIWTEYIFEKKEKQAK